MSYETQQSPLPPVGPPQQPARNGLGVAALILGIIGALSGLIPLFFWLAGILGVIGLILGLSGRGRAKRGQATNKGVATAGAVLALIALGLSVWGMVVTFRAVDDVVKDIDKATSSHSATKEPGQGSGAKGDAEGEADTKDGGAGDNGGGTGDGPLGAGETASYDGKVKVTVSAPKPYSPSEYAAGHTEGNKAYQVTVVIENTGKEKFDATLTTVQARAGADGVDAEEIFDDNTGTGFAGNVLPGKKATVSFAFDTPADAGTLTVEVSPGFTYDASQWDLTT
ncbi:DUF4190 domain-containing protein [Streptomyces sp. NPDC012623]|uniref:DUF4190 domain-containing protein n=1 Tax=unclassified Streptomyces TaxID=2593676 RepID=UPI003693F06D